MERSISLSLASIMNYCIRVLLFAVLATTALAQSTCWQKSYKRTIYYKDSCEPGWENYLDACYGPCPAGYLPYHDICYQVLERACLLLLRKVYSILVFFGFSRIYK